MKAPGEGQRAPGHRFRALCLGLLLASPALPAQTLERAESLWRARRFREANDAFRALVDAHPKNPDYRVRWGRFLLENFAPKDAVSLFQEALESRKDHAGALLGLALEAARSFQGKAESFARQALASDPKLLEAQELLARLALENNNPQLAIEEADKAIAMSPDALNAMAVRATIDWMEDRAETPWIGRILARSPGYGEAYALAAHLFVINRRYEEGIRSYRQALELKPELWDTRTQLGINLMRLGQEAEAREHLEKAFHAGHLDPAVGNTLKLLDSYKNYATLRNASFILRLHNKEAELLRPYFEDELRRAIATYERKYQFKLDRPLQVEVYPEHEDFAVRTLGMPGIGGILGVTFGHVVAMDSPSGRKPGSYHWASTLWHELSHVFVLTATRHRVPRWFTEGMAVHEETAASPEWGDRLGPEILKAIRDKTLLPVAGLDRGFVHPQYPEQVQVSYFQAGRICDFIAKEWGYAKLLEMMRAFGRNQTTAEVVERQLGLKPEEFDRRFLTALEAETKQVAQGFEEWRKRLKALAAQAKAQEHDTVIREGTAIRDWYPEYVETGSVYEFLARAYLARNNHAAAAAELERYAKIGGRDPELLRLLAKLHEEAGRPKEAVAALERILYVYPLDTGVHARLGDLLMAQGRLDGAIREYRAVLARKPADPAASHFNLARALRAANRAAEAKEQLLLALEVAPGFRPAQKLLLELSK